MDLQAVPLPKSRRMSAVASSLERSKLNPGVVKIIRAAGPVLGTAAESQRVVLRQVRTLASPSCEGSIRSPVADPVAAPVHSRLICGVPVRCRNSAASSSLPPSVLLLTPTSSANLRAVALALARWSTSPDSACPIILEGPAGCGKSSVIRHVASACGFADDLVELHLDDALDSKALLGSYVCAERPGEFVWQAGVITEAVLAGRWVVIEDADRAPFEVLAALVLLMQTRTLHLPGRPRPIPAHPDFLLLATRTTATHATLPAASSATGGLAPSPTSSDGAGLMGAIDVTGSSFADGAAIASPVSGALASVIHLWTRVPIRPLDSSRAPSPPSGPSPSLSPFTVSSLHPELQAVVSGLYPRLPREVVDALMAVSRGGGSALSVAHATLTCSLTRPLQVFHVVSLASQLSAGGAESRAPAGLPPALQRPWMRSFASFGRTLSPRDALKLASRVATLTRAGSISSASPDSSQHLFVRLSDADREQLLAEALDVFALHIPAAAARRDMAVTLALVLGLGEDSATAVVSRKPALSCRAVTSAGDDAGAGRVLGVGRAQFHLAPGSTSEVLPGGAVLPRGYAATRLGHRVLEAVAVCVRMREPALLVGSTGVGKTTAVQARAQLRHQAYGPH